jgi:hypothetical protein
MIRVLLSLLCPLLIASSAFAEKKQSAADILMKSVADPKVEAGAAPQANSNVVVMDLSGIKLDNPFALQLFSLWQTADRLPYHANMWVKKALSADYAGAAHLWTQVEKDLPSAFLPTARATKAYLFWRLNLAQPFLDAWLSELSKGQEIRDSKIIQALHQTIQPGFSAWLIDNSVFLNAEQSQFVIQELRDAAPNPVIDSLRGWTLLRRSRANLELAVRTLERLPVQDPLKAPLARSVGLALALSGDLAKTGQVFKQHLEPAIIKAGDPTLLSQYYLQIARLLYQADALDAAEEFYRKIPNKRAEFLVAREELSWILLRKNDVSELRGELKNFKLGLFDEQFLPEALVVSAISNLKQCFYGKVEDDFRNFVEKQRVWANRIETELKSALPTKLGTGDDFLRWADLAREKREAELARIDILGKESITAVVPAVGVQAHWQELALRQSNTLDLAKKFQTDERRRAWKMRGDALREAIRKMKFVKVELLSQMSTLAEKSKVEQKSLSEETRKLAAKEDTNSIMFPFDGVIWNDEVFRLRSVTESVCL